MSVLSRGLSGRALTLRGVAISAMLGATILAGALNPAWAQDGATTQVNPTVPAQPTHHWAHGARHHVETVEQRIASLHHALMITPDEEPAWSTVAQAMRDNAAAMQNLEAANVSRDPASLSALDELLIYQKFAQAHVDGLKNLIASFQTLYTLMPDPQKKRADEVFRAFGHKTHPVRG